MRVGGPERNTQAKSEKRLARWGSKSLADKGSHLQKWQIVSEKIIACHGKKWLIE